MFSTYFNFELSRAQRSVFAALVALALAVTPLAAPMLAYAEETGSDAGAQTEQTSGGDESSGDTGAGGSDGESTGDTVVQTGDATSNADATTEANTNTTSVNEGSEEGGDETTESSEGTEGTESSTESTEGDAETEGSDAEQLTVGDESEGTGTTTVTVASENHATSTQEVGSEATTGDNGAEAAGGNAIIDTGDALATANVINTINTNIVNSTGALYLLSRLFGGTLDLSSLFASLGTSGSGSSPCTLSTCSGSNTTFNVYATNTAKIVNDVVVRASTGENSATSTAGGAYIQTGNAGAAANVVNVANTNIIDSNYLLVSINNLGSLFGDIVLPTGDFFSALFGSGRPVGGNVSVENNNDANVENDINADARTGDNEATVGTAATSTDSGEGGTIDTGNAASSANSTNIVNTNLFGGTAIHLLFRINGSWNGSVFGAPPGLSWAQTPYGLELYTDGSAQGAGGGAPLSNLNVSNNNTADIENNVSVVALTGDNKATGGSAANIRTGNAYAGANVINVVNTNVVGQNWIFAVFNIMGDWSGNLSFGQTDLWVGARAEGPMTPGSLVDFTLTVTNLGNATANDAVLNAAFSNDLLEMVGGDLEWDLGTLPAGTTIERTFQARIADGLPGGQFPVELTATADSYEPDADDSNNSDQLTLVVDNGEAIEFYNLASEMTPPSDLQITKTASVSSVTVPATVDYEVVIKNLGGPAYHAELVDVLVDPNDNVIHEQVWPLDTIKPNEEITITYSVQFEGDIPSGTYKNYAQVYAITRHWSLDPFYGTFGDSEEVTTTVEVLSDIAPEPVAQESTQCVPLLSSYIRDDQANDPAEVQKLQQFLRDQGYASVLNTGIYDDATKAAVTDYQEAHADEILEPWGAPNGTGYVYYTTQKHINETYCADEAFPLTERQLAEIRRLKARIEDLRDVSGQPVIPDNAPIGLAEPTTPVTPTYTAAPPNAAETQAAAAAAAGGAEISSPRSLIDTVIDALRNLFGRANGDHVSVR